LAYIYILTNKINGKKYVGQTTKEIKNRLYEHKHEANNRCKQIIHKAIKKYGWNNFDVTYFECSKEILDAMERILIYLWDTQIPNGYNAESGGCINKSHSNETKEIIRQDHLKNKYTVGDKNYFYDKHFYGEDNPFYSKHHTDETKIKLSNANKGRFAGKNNSCYGKYGANHPAYGNKHSEETKQKISKAHKGKIVSEETKIKISKRVICIETGEIFNSIKNASKVKNIDASSISACCKGKLKTAGKLHWKYYEESI
jgi:group I intron endonuclease